MAAASLALLAGLYGKTSGEMISEARAAADHIGAQVDRIRISKDPAAAEALAHSADGLRRHALKLQQRLLSEARDA